jgi:hypothetical protein
VVNGLAKGVQPFLHYGKDTAENFIDAAFAIDYDHTQRVALGDGAIHLVGAAEKFRIEQLETIFIAARVFEHALVAAAGAFE